MDSNNNNGTNILSLMKQSVMGTINGLKAIPGLYNKRREKVRALKEKYRYEKERNNAFQYVAIGEANTENEPVKEFVRPSQHEDLLKQPNSISRVKETVKTQLYGHSGIKQFLKLDFSPGDYFKKFNPRIVASLVIVLFLGLFVANELTVVNAYAIEVDGKTVTTLGNKTQADSLLKRLEAEKVKVWKRKVTAQQTVLVNNVYVKKYELDSNISAKNKLKKVITFVATASAIKADGNITVVLKDHNIANDVLQKLLESYKAPGMNIQDSSFAEKVEIVDIPVSLAEVVSPEKALQLLKEGKQEKKVYKVKPGDSLWSIARVNDMHVADLLKLNPSLSEHIDLGQDVNLVALEPMINVVLKGQQTTNEEIPYKVVYKKDSSISRGKEKVKVEGQTGQRQVTYDIVLKNGIIASKQVLNQKVLKQPTNKLVLNGTKNAVVAMREGSSISRYIGGKFSWPLFGRITSSFGKRWGRQHEGIDIDGDTGDPVHAAGSGVIISAGWDGGYGKLVTIRHTNGVVTKYGHLSKINVSVGEKVSKGEVIGRVGSTGHSTGSHLHFEVLNGGKNVNPKRVIK